MPNEARRPWTLDGLKKRITGCTKKIGEAVRNNDTATADTLRSRRKAALIKLVSKFNVYALINAEGGTEFVDRAEWEQRMIAWGRRNGLAPRARVSLRSRPATPAAPAPGQTPASHGTDFVPPPPPPPVADGTGPTPPTVPGN